MASTRLCADTPDTARWIGSAALESGPRVHGASRRQSPAATKRSITAWCGRSSSRTCRLWLERSSSCSSRDDRAVGPQHGDWAQKPLHAVGHEHLLLGERTLDGDAPLRSMRFHRRVRSSGLIWPARVHSCLRPTGTGSSGAPPPIHDLRRPRPAGRQGTRRTVRRQPPASGAQTRPRKGN